MARFRYTGSDLSGAPVRGTAEADTPWVLVQSLQADGITVYSTDPTDAPRTSEHPRPLRIEELTLFIGQLAALVKSGMPLAPALGEVAREAQSRRMRDILEHAQRAVSGGDSLEAVLSRYGSALPPLYLSLIRVGERTGNLPGVLQRLAAYGQRDAWVRQRVLLAAAYPAFLLAALIVFLGLFVPEVIGQFRDLYTQFGADLPSVSSAVLTAGEWMRVAGIPLIAILVVCAVAGRLLHRFLHGGHPLHLLRDRVARQMPVIGPLYRAVLHGRFYRALGMLLEHGTPVVESLHLAGLASGSIGLQEMAMRAAERVAQGEGIGSALKAHGHFPATHSWMLQQGESQGDFLNTLARLAEWCEREAEQRQQRVLSRLGPTLISVCGVLVALAVIGCITPVFEFATLLQG